jgi:hypothetical protein
MSGWRSFNFTMRSVGDGSSKPAKPPKEKSRPSGLELSLTPDTSGNPQIIVSHDPLQLRELSMAIDS